MKRAARGEIRAVADRPATATIAEVVAHSATSPAARPARVWPVAPRRVAWPESSSSQRPASSSPRSSRVAASRPQMAPTTPRTPRLRQAVNPVTVSSRRAGPMSAFTAALAPKRRANCSRSAGVL